MTLHPPAAPSAVSLTLPAAAGAPVLARHTTRDRFQPLWIFAAMALGLLLGRVYPGLGTVLDRVQVAGVSVPIAVGLLWMMYPVLA
jgi:ACR3 family arsenite efflux pump ArsB